jgi:hypothetical protein
MFLFSMENCQFAENASVSWYPIHELPEDFVESERVPLEKLKQYYL